MRPRLVLAEVHHDTLGVRVLVEHLLQRLPPPDPLAGVLPGVRVGGGRGDHVLPAEDRVHVLLGEHDVAVLVLDEEVLAVRDVDPPHGRHQPQPVVLGSPPSQGRADGSSPS